MIKIFKIINKNIRFILLNIKIEAIEIAIKDNIEAKEEYLVIIKMISQIKIKKNPKLKLIPNIKPI
tara:strand:+ start:330 stop:527 length:198 start_codon:yes stop_codon:yes gene_type:complete